MNHSAHHIDHQTVLALTLQRLALYLVVISVSAAAQTDSLKTGQRAPVFTLEDISTGSAFRLEEYQDTTGGNTGTPQVVVLNFWATWCKPSEIEIPFLANAAEEFASRPVRFVLVNTLELPGVGRDSVRSVIGARGYSLGCLLDEKGSVASAYNMRGLPATVVIDRKGIIRAIHRGYDAGMPARLRATLWSLLGEAPGKGVEVAVVGFGVRGKTDQASADRVVDSLATALARSGGISVMSRADATSGLEKYGTSSDDCEDVECLAKAGKLLNARYVVTGSLAGTGSMFNVLVQVVDVHSAKIVAFDNFMVRGTVEDLIAEKISVSARKLMASLRDRKP